MKRFIFPILLFICILLLITAGSYICLSDESIEGIISSYMNSLISVIGKESGRFYIGYKQGMDTSCGIAATATLLRFFYCIDIDENQLINLFFTELKKKDDYTLSMLDIKQSLNITGLFPWD